MSFGDNFTDLFSVGILIIFLTGIQQNTVCPEVARCLHSTLLYMVKFDLSLLLVHCQVDVNLAMLLDSGFHLFGL